MSWNIYADFVEVETTLKDAAADVASMKSILAKLAPFITSVASLLPATQQVTVDALVAEINVLVADLPVVTPTPSPVTPAVPVTPVVTPTK